MRTKIEINLKNNDNNYAFNIYLNVHPNKSLLLLSLYLIEYIPR